MNTLLNNISTGRGIWQTTLLCLFLVLGGCGGGGGGAEAPVVDSGPAPSNANVPGPTALAPPEQPNYYAESLSAIAVITNVTIASAPVVDFTLVDEDGIALTGLTSGNVRLHIAKLIPASNGDSSYWQSYINRSKTPNVNPENAPAIQATSERGGSLVDHGDGTYTYTFVNDIANITAPMAVAYEPDLTHRVGMQFSGGPPLNPTFDWVPASGATSGIETREVVAIETCNTCHNPLRMHGGGRFDTKLCVMCHNPGTTEPNSLESVDFSVMVHRIHRGADLPSVEAGGEFVIYGYRDSRHDYSEVIFPQDVNNCAKCHTGSATSDAAVVAPVVTNHGDNWVEVPTMEACGSCHDDVDFTTHEGGQADNSGCQSCHNVSGIAGSVADVHRNKALEASSQYAIAVSSITNTAPGEFPVITFSVINPENNDAPYDILADPVWTSGRLRAALSWSTDDFTNTGASEDGKPFYARTDALINSVDNGDGTYTLTSEVAIPDGSAAPFRRASGSGMLTFEGRANTADGRVLLFNDPTYFSIDEASGQATARRQVVSVENCNQCHAQLNYHGGTRTNPEAQCQACHTPRIATDEGEPIDFKRMIHGIHGAGFREEALIIRGDPFDTSVVHFPGEISDCHTCHVNDSFTVPLANNVLASTWDMGSDLADPSDDVMITRTAAVCSSCHDSSVAQSHMTQNGGDFEATEASSAVDTETCEICHGPGRIADVQSVHHDPVAN